MKQTLNQVKLLFAEIASEHKQLNHFFWGEFNRATSEETLAYPLLLVDTVNANITRNGIDLVLQITVADSVLKGYQNLDETFNDTLLVLKDVLDTMRSPRWGIFSSIGDSGTAERFYQRGADETAGWYIRQTLRIESQKNLCAIPFDNYNFDGTFVSNCEPVDIFENGILVDTVDSGGSYSYSTACADGTNNVNKSDGALIESVTVPSGSTIETNVADSPIESSGATPLYNSVVKATETFVIPDVAWTDSDSTPQTSEYGAAITCAASVINTTGAQTLHTGQTVSYATNDDSSRDFGRDVSHYILSWTNYFGHSQRFTSTIGGYYDQTLAGYYDVNGVASSYAIQFADDIVIDFASFVEKTGAVQMYVASINTTLINGTWATLLAATPLTHSIYSDWYVFNSNIAASLCDWGKSRFLNWLPLGLTVNLVTSTTNPSNTAQAFRITTTPNIAAQNKTSTNQTIFYRLGNISEL